MRRVLVTLCLVVLSCTILEAKPSSKRRVSPGVTRPESGIPQPTPRERFWRLLFGVTTMDDSPPPAPRDHGPVP